MSERSDPTGRRGAAGLVKAALALTVLAGVLWAGWERVRQLDTAALRPAAGWLVLSLLLLVGQQLASALVYRRVLRALGADIARAPLLRLYLWSLLSRYVPGRVWPLAGRVVLGQRAGVAAEHSTLATMLETLLALAAGLLAAGLTLPALALEAQSAGLRRLPWLALLLVGVALALLHPALLGRLLELAGRVLRRPLASVDLGYPRMLGLLPSFVLLWQLLGLAFWCFLRAFTPLPPSGLPLALGAFALAWTAGFLSLLPSGLGVRELTLGVLLTPVVGPLAVPLALAARVWTIAAELLSAALVWLWLGRERLEPPAGS